MRARVQSIKSAAAMIVLLLVAAGCGGGSSSSQTEVGTPQSIVVIGDSIATGERNNYGYTYSTGFLNEWTGGTENRVRQGQ